MVAETKGYAPGTVLEGKHKGLTHRVTVLEGTEESKGKPTFRLDDGREFKSLVLALTALTGWKGANAQKFWYVEGTKVAKPRAERQPRQKKEKPEASADGAVAEKPKRQRKVKAEQKVKRTINPMDNQEGAEEGEVRYYCDSCMESFTASESLPDSCPNGHPAVLTETADVA